MSISSATTPATGPEAILLVNLGTPAAPTPEAVRAFLGEFLADRRVIDLPRWLWLPVLKGIILRRRPPRVAQAYAHLWEAWGDSPLRLITQRQVAALQSLLDAGSIPARVAYAFVYGSPSIAETLQRWQAEGLTRVRILPLYPQFSWTTTGSVLDQLAGIRRQFPALQCEVIESYADNGDYLDALAGSVRHFWREKGDEPERLLMSFHGIPKRYVEQGDPYQAQCLQTASALAARLGRDASGCAASFQSRFGFAEWVKPYTIDTLREWGRAGVKTVDVVCPSFSADCLETLEEITLECGTAFREAGGERLRLVPCLNDDAAHIRMMKNLVLA